MKKRLTANSEAELDILEVWVKEMRDVAYRIEDVIDIYILHLPQPRFNNFLHRFACLVGKLKPRHVVASEIQDIKISLDQIKKRYERYGINSLELLSSGSTSDSTRNDSRLACLYKEEADLVGIESSRDEVVGWLHDEASKRVMISLVGMGGLGKTTLAKKVYDNQTRQFRCHAWIVVSQSYKEEEVLRTMIKQFHESTNESPPQGIDAMEKRSLIDKVREFLQQKRYLVVFDDVWKISFWEFIRNALPDDNKGSRVIITTRYDEVARSCKESKIDHIKNLQPLPEEKSLAALLQESILVVFCQRKRRPCPQWQKFNASIGSQLGSDPRLKNAKRILFLSYHDLPYHLKFCFLYFGMVPEDYSISCVRLIRLWIAENFVKGEKGKTLEDVAQEYLTELIQRNLVQVSWVDFDGKARSCRVHDLIREMILKKSQESCFCQVLAQGDSRFDAQSRRLSIHNNIDIVPESTSDSRIRSLFLFEVNKLPESLLQTLFASFKLLKVLDFQDASLDYLPKEVGNLLHLRYLSVRNTKVKMLPKSVGKLHNLQTLDLKKSLVQELPVEINRLCKLRHLLAYYLDWTATQVNFQRGVKIHKGVGRLKDLQKLYSVEANHEVNLIRELRNLRQLRKLGITKLTRDTGSALGTSIKEMHQLESLDVYALSEDEVIDIQNISPPPRFLRRLYLQGRLENMPTWISSLKNLVRIRLKWSRMRCDPLKALKFLDNLLELGLHEAYDGEKLHFEEGGFKKLKS
ncbi:hypothetical protein F0562_012302 [Nyssa sinensis]|uniref:Uncharacterized protein n=1 Tax=Nyssa sinensis TaxID=561372 RepID=A0A5J4ZU71_9ASTE|nr:hypothetical protein F0562_012302 [Nyssa sinensis]